MLDDLCRKPGEFLILQDIDEIRRRNASLAEIAPRVP